jgi:hypothetical protein
MSWSDYPGPKDLQEPRKTISPQHMVWDVVRISCRQDAKPDRPYYIVAFDAATKRPLTRTHI